MESVRRGVSECSIACFSPTLLALRPCVRARVPGSARGREGVCSQTHTHTMPLPSTARRRPALRGGGAAPGAGRLPPAVAAGDLFSVLEADLAAAAAALPPTPADLLAVATFQTPGAHADAGYADQADPRSVTGCRPLAAAARPVTPASTLAWLAEGARAEAVALGGNLDAAGTGWEGAVAAWSAGGALHPSVHRAIERAAGRPDPGDPSLGPLFALEPVRDADGNAAPQDDTQQDDPDPPREGEGDNSGSSEGEEEEDVKNDLGWAPRPPPKAAGRRGRASAPSPLDAAAEVEETAAAVLAEAGAAALALPRDDARLPALRWAAAAASLEAQVAAEEGGDGPPAGDGEEEEEEVEPFKAGDADDADFSFSDGEGEGGGDGGAWTLRPLHPSRPAPPAPAGGGAPHAHLALASGSDDSSGDEWGAARTRVAAGDASSVLAPALAALAGAESRGAAARGVERRRAARARARARRRASLAGTSYADRASKVAFDVLESSMLGGEPGSVEAAERGSSGDEADTLEDEARWAPLPPTDVREPSGATAARRAAGGVDPRPGAPKPAYAPAAVAVGAGGGGEGDLGLALMARGVFSVRAARGALHLAQPAPAGGGPPSLLSRLRRGWSGVGGGRADVGFGVYARPAAAAPALARAWASPVVAGVEVGAGEEEEHGSPRASFTIDTALPPSEAAATDPALYRDIAARAGALGLTVMAWVPRPVPAAEVAAALADAAKANAAAAAGDAFKADVAARAALLKAGGLPPLPRAADVKALAWPPLQSLRDDIQAADALAAQLTRVAADTAAGEGAASGWIDGDGRLLPGAKLLFTSTPGGNLLVEALPAPPARRPTPQATGLLSSLAYLVAGSALAGEARGAAPNPAHDGDGPGDPLAPPTTRPAARLLAWAPAPAARVAAAALLGPLAPDPIARGRLGTRLLFHARGGALPGDEPASRAAWDAAPRSWLTLPGVVSGADALAAMPAQWADAIDPAAAAWELPVAGSGDAGPPLLLVGARGAGWVDE